MKQNRNKITIEQIKWCYPLGVICLGFAAITFVASNWDQINRIGKVIMLFGAMWTSWALAVWFHAKERFWLAESFVMLACVLFGAGIMLISQIYHIEGEPRDATWLWAVGTFLGAACARSVPALVLTIILFTVWSLMGVDLFRGNDDVDMSYPAYLVACGGLAWWLHSRLSAHFIVLGFSVWGFSTIFTNLDDDVSLPYLIAFYGVFVLLSVVLFSEGKRHFLRGFELAASAYLVLILMILMLVWYIMADEYNADEFLPLFENAYTFGVPAAVFCGAVAYFGKDGTNLYDLCVVPVATLLASLLQSFGHEVDFVLEAFFLAVSIWLIRMGWRLEFRPISFLGYVSFASVMLLIYFITVGSLIGTSAFYLSAGVLLLAGVYFVPKLMPKKPEEEAQ